MESVEYGRKGSSKLREKDKERYFDVRCSKHEEDLLFKNWQNKMDAKYKIIKRPSLANSNLAVYSTVME